MSNIDFTNFLNSMLTSITTNQILNVLCVIVAVGMTFVLMWFGVRKITTQFTEMVAFGKWALTGKPEAWDKYDDIVSAREAGMSVKDYKNWVNEKMSKPKPFTHEEIREALRTNSAYSEATMTGPSGLPMGRPIEPVEPTGKPMTKKERKEFDDWYSTHDSFGHELGYDKRNWENWYKKNKNKYKKKYNNYKKKYYYDSHGNKYYK